ncbi:lysophospholipid acyltransferase family protein [Candidatus Omnitrophota bacterium]
MLKKLKIFILKIIYYMLKGVVDTHLMISVAIAGQENFKKIPHESGIIIAANHSSALDIAVIARAFHDHLIRTSWIVSKYNSKLWYLQWCFWLFKCIIVNGSVAKAKADLEDGRWVVIFPKGGEKWCPPRKVKTKKKPGYGTAILALSTGLPILPIGISGADKVLPPKSCRYKPWHTITLRIGEPFSFDIVNQEQLKDRDLLAKKTDYIMERIYELT